MRIYLSRPHMSGKELFFVKEAFESNFIAPVGPHIDAFEKSVESYFGKGYYCVALSSGTAALHLALIASGVKEGDHVWVSSMTFAGGVFPINYLNAVPSFIDLDKNSWTISLEILTDRLAIAEKNGSLPKAIIPTDLYGQSVDLDGLESITRHYGISLIVDSAESLGANYLNGRKAGTGGDASILSFNGNKIITTSGGGMLVTKHRHWAEQARFLATQARDPAPHYQHSSFGYNYRLSNVSAAIGLGQMEVLEDRVKARRRIFARYRQELEPLGIVFMPEPMGYRSTNWLTAIRIDPILTGFTREQVRKKLLEHDIESRPLWKPMHIQPLYSNSAYFGRNFDVELFNDGLCLPSGSDLLDAQQDEVISHIRAMI